MLDVKSWSTQWAGRTLTIEVGRYALQADASCTVRYGDTEILATVVKSNNIRDGIDYFPLMVDFEEKLYAAGKIKGSRFIKREGRPSDDAILSGRLIDRAIRPLFDKRIRNDIQIVITALAVDGENDATIVGLIGASCVLTLSSIQWNGPIGAGRIGYNKETREFILGVTTKQIENNESTLDLVVAGTPNRLVMVEAGAKEVPNNVAYDAMKWGCEQLQPVVALIQKIQKEVGQEKEVMLELADDIVDNEEQARQVTKQFIIDQADDMIFNSVKISRKERNAMIDMMKDAVKIHLTENGIDEDAQKAGLKNIKEYLSAVISERILDKEQRLDGRKITGIRELQSAVDLLPRVHGTGMFMRGDTQVLSIVTLGSPGDVQTLDSMEAAGTKRYMHHYNDAPFTYGDVRPMRGPSRRAIGHGVLAERALKPVLPLEADFPYAIRVVSEVMGSNGSSSMASICGSTLSLMAAGVPIKKPVAGIAMGLVSQGLHRKVDTENSRWKVLTDLQDIEDGDGGMDFKIAGTRDGITAIQMDTKTYGLTWDIVKQTIAQSGVARLQILDQMAITIAEPRANLSDYAPRITTIQIDPEKIRDVIGPGGKVINKIIEDTGVQIDIEQDGRVMVTSNDADGMEQAIKIITSLTKEVEAGENYNGKVVRLEDFGAFVQILPNKDGLVHVSEIAWERTNKPSDVLKIGDKVKVQVKEIDNLGRVNLSMKVLMNKPDTYKNKTSDGFDRHKISFTSSGKS